MAGFGAAAVDVRRGLLQAPAFRFLPAAETDLAFHHEPLPAVAAGPHQAQVGAAVVGGLFAVEPADSVFGMFPETLSETAQECRKIETAIPRDEPGRGEFDDFNRDCRVASRRMTSR